MGLAHGPLPQPRDKGCLEKIHQFNPPWRQKLAAFAGSTRYRVYQLHDMGLKGLTCDRGILMPQMGKRLPVTPNEARRMQCTDYVIVTCCKVLVTRTEGVLVGIASAESHTTE